jgi:hypothetical protein
VSHLSENEKNNFWDRVGYGLKFIDPCAKLYELIIDSGEVLGGRPKYPPPVLKYGSKYLNLKKWGQSGDKFGKKYKKGFG